MWRGCKDPASYDIISRDITGKESRLMCCFYHGMTVVNVNHDYGHPVHDCVITPADGILIGDV